MSPATIELTVPDISCASCKANIEGDLAIEPGIEQVAVDVATRRVHIAYDQEQTSPDQLRAKLSEIGYPAVPCEAGHPQPHVPDE
jgi:copper chaperone CopZ